MNILANSQKVHLLFWRSACAFSKFSHRQTTPKILRDHRFTRNGMVMGKQPKAVTVSPEDIPISQAHLEHLFSNKAEDLKLLREQAEQKEKNIMNKHIFQDHSVPDTLILEISDAFLIANHPEKVLNNILEIEKKFINSSSKTTTDQSELRELIIHALNKIITQKIRSLSLRNFGVLVTLSRRFVANDAKTWENLANNFCRLLQNQEYHDKEILSGSRSQKQIENVVFTLTSVLKQAKRFQLTSSLESLTDAAQSFLTSNTSLIANDDQRFLLISNVLPLAPYRKQIELLEQIRAPANLSTIGTLKSTTLTALTHALYKTRQINAANPKFPAATLIDTQILQKVEQSWIKSFDGKNEDILSVYGYAMASLGYSGETKAIVSKYVEKNVANVTNLHNLAFLGETLKKYKALNQKYFDVANVTLLNKTVAPELALQFLRITSNKLAFQPETAKPLIEQLNHAFYMRKYAPKQSEQEMIVKTLNNYSAIIDLESLPLYLTLTGSKKIF